MTRERKAVGDWRALPLHAARIANDAHEATRIKELYQREGAQVRVYPRRVTAGGAVVWLFVIVARKGTYGPENTGGAPDRGLSYR